MISRKRLQTTRIVGGIFLLVGLLVTSAGGACFWHTHQLLNHGLRSLGTVVEFRKRSTSSRYYTPVVQFETSDHRQITGVCKTGSNPPIHKVGDSVTVIYRPTSPDDICLDEPLELWLLTWLLGGIGLVFSIISGGMLIYSFRKRNVSKL